MNLGLRPPRHQHLGTSTCIGGFLPAANVLDGLRGAPFVDANGDGAISVGELALQAHDEMALAEEQHASLALSGRFSRETILAAPTPRPRTPIGMRVKAKQDGEWYAARIVAARSGQLQVDYIGYDEPDEWFLEGDTTQIRMIRVKATFPIGAAVEVRWKGDWYAAKVLKVDGGAHFIHYIEDDSSWDASWDEWVSSQRIRAPQGGKLSSAAKGCWEQRENLLPKFGRRLHRQRKVSFWQSK